MKVRESGMPERPIGVKRGGWQSTSGRVRICVDVEDTPASSVFFERLKPRLKARFQQLEIWIVSFEIRIV
jgi:hypothetical protein